MEEFLQLVAETFQSSQTAYLDDLQKFTAMPSAGLLDLATRFDNLAPGSSSDASQVVFKNPQAGTIGSLGLSSISGPRNYNVDFSALKRTRIAENMNVEFRAEIFNLLNTVNFDNPDTNINSASFGRISNTVGRPRLMQFALRLNF